MRVFLRRLWCLLVLAPLLCAAPGCHRHDKTELRLFAAASLQDAMHELARRYQAEHPDVAVELNFAGSNALARQIASSRVCMFTSRQTRSGWITSKRSSCSFLAPAARS